MVTARYAAASLPAYSFANCDNLASVELVEGVTSVNGDMFWGSPKLKQVSIPASVTTIANSFLSGSYVEQVSVDANNTKFMSSDGVLYNKDGTFLWSYPPSKVGTSFTIPNGVTKILSDSFYSSKKLESIAIPSTVDEVSQNAFAYSKKLASVEIGTPKLGKSAFIGCDELVNVWIRSSCTTIGELEFTGSPLLQRIYAEASSAQSGWAAKWNRISLDSGDTSTYPVTYNQATRPW